MKKVSWQNWTTLVLGIWVFLTPWLISHHMAINLENSVNWNAWVVGGIVAVSAGMALQELEPWEEWVNLVVGVWFVLSPWIFGYAGESTLMWNSVIVGAVIAVLSAISIPVARELKQQNF